MVDQISISPERMQAERLARFQDLQPNSEAFVDIRIPGNARDVLTVIGRGVSENDDFTVPIEASGFNLAWVRAPHNNGASLHFHDTTEVFIAIKGQWEIFWKNLEGDEHKAVLEPFDTISVPVGVSRGFRNLGDESNLMLAILEGTDAGRVHWPPETVAEGRKYGLDLDEHGDLVEVGTARG